MRLLGCLMVALVSAPALAEGKRLAVLEFRNKVQGSDRQKVDSGYFTDAVRGDALQDVPGLQVMTRENLLVLLESTGKKLEECEGECEVDTGRRVGADLVVSGELLRIGSNFKLNMRLHETKTGWLLAAAVASGKSVDELDESTAQAVSKLITPLNPAAAPAPAAPSAPVASASPPPTPATPAPVAAAAPDGDALADVGDLLKDPFADYEAQKKPPATVAQASAPPEAAPAPQKSPLCLQVARIAETAQRNFEPLKSGNLRVNGDGDRIWDSQIALLQNQPCAIWSYADTRVPTAQRCKVVDLGACWQTETLYRNAVADLRSCLGTEMRVSEQKSTAEGVTRAELRGRGLAVRLEMTEDMGRCDVNLSVEAR